LTRFTFVRLNARSASASQSSSVEVADFDETPWALDYARSILARSRRFRAVEVFAADLRVALIARAPNSKRAADPAPPASC
jgi:hypothetical protein